MAGILANGASGIADDEFGHHALMDGGDAAVVLCNRNGLEQNAYRGGAHALHGLADGGQGRIVESGLIDVVEADDGAVGGDAESVFLEGADCAEGGEVVESD